MTQKKCLRTHILHAAALGAVALGFSSILVPSAAAQVPTVHELQLKVDAVSIPLDLVDRGIVPAGGVYQWTVTSPPVLGQLFGEDYLPKDDFWQAGADQLTIEVSPLVGAVTRHTFLLTVAPPVPEIPGFSADFELSVELSQWTHTGDSGVLSYVDPGIDGNSLRAFMGQSGAADIGRGLDDHSEGNHGIGTAGTTIAGPPENVQTDPAVAGWVNFLSAGPDQTLSLIYLQLRLHQGDYWMRASTTPDGDAACSSCATPWRPVPDQQRVTYTLWSGPKVISDVGKHGDGLYFALDLPGTADDTLDWLPGFYDISYTRYGFQDSERLASLEVLYDNLRTWTEEYTFGSQTLIFDDFEEGGDSAWTVDGPVTVATSGALEGVYGAEIDIEALRSGGSMDAILIDTSPEPVDAIREVQMQMTVDLSSVTLANGKGIRLVCGSSSESPDTGLHFSLLLYRQQGVNKVRARARDDVAFLHKTPLYALTNSTPRLTMRWVSSSLANGGGSVTLWVDGQKAGEIGNFDNDSKILDSLAFGACKPSLSLSNGSGAEEPLRIDDIHVVAR